MPAGLIDAALPNASKRFGSYGARGTPSQRLRRLSRIPPAGCAHSRRAPT